MVIASAVIASSALPHIMEPQCLQVRRGRTHCAGRPRSLFRRLLKHDVAGAAQQDVFAKLPLHNCLRWSRTFCHFFTAARQPGAPELFRSGRGLRSGFLILCRAFPQA